MDVSRSLVFKGGTTIRQGTTNVEVNSSLYGQGAPSARTYDGTYVMDDRDDPLEVGPALVQFSSGDEGDGVITEVKGRSGRFSIRGPLRELDGYGPRG